MQGRLGIRWVMRRTCSQLHLGQKLEGRENKGPISVQVWVGKTRSPQRQIRAGGWTMVLRWPKVRETTAWRVWGPSRGDWKENVRGKRWPSRKRRSNA